MLGWCGETSGQLHGIAKQMPKLWPQCVLFSPCNIYQVQISVSFFFCRPFHFPLLFSHLLPVCVCLIAHWFTWPQLWFVEERKANEKWQRQRKNKVYENVRRVNWLFTESIRFCAARVNLPVQCMHTLVWLHFSCHLLRYCDLTIHRYFPIYLNSLYLRFGSYSYMIDTMKYAVDDFQ